MDAVITPEAMVRYRRTAQAREAARQREAQIRRKAAWAVARQAARVLKETFGATQVIAFGSLVHNAWFGPRSDIDLAVEGVTPDAFWRAWCTLDRLDPAFEIDLVAIESVAKNLRDEIVSQGIAL